MKEDNDSVNSVKARILYKEIKPLERIKNEIDSLNMKANPVFDAISPIITLVISSVFLNYTDIKQDIYSIFCDVSFMVGLHFNLGIDNKKLHKRINLIKTLLDYRTE